MTCPMLFKFCMLRYVIKYTILNCSTPKNIGSKDVHCLAKAQAMTKGGAEHYLHPFVISTKLPTRVMEIH